MTILLPAWWEDDERYLAYQLTQLEPRRDAYIAGFKIRRILTNTGGRNRSFFNVWKNMAQPQTYKTAKALARMLCTCEMEQAS